MFYLHRWKSCLVDSQLFIVVVLQNSIVNGELACTNAHTHTPVLVHWNCGIYMNCSRTPTHTKNVTRSLPCYHDRSGVVLNTVINHTDLCMIYCGGDKMTSVCNSFWSR